MKLIILYLSIFSCLIVGVNARDLGQWEGVDRFGSGTRP